MKIILEFDAYTSFYLSWLSLLQRKGTHQSAEDILRPLISAEFQRLQPKQNMEGSPTREDGGCIGKTVASAANAVTEPSAQNQRPQPKTEK